MSGKYPKNWNLQSFFPSLESTEYQSFVTDLEKRKTEILALVKAAPTLTPDHFTWWGDFLKTYESFFTHAHHAINYVYMLSSIDTKSEAYPKELGRFSQWMATLEPINLALENALRSATQEHINAFCKVPAVADLDYFIQRTRERAAYRMTDELETLATELSVDGEGAWGQLHSRIVGRLKFELKVAGQEPQTTSFSKKVSLLGSPDADVRRAALQGSNEALKAYEDVFAAALNAIAGSRHTLIKQRGQKGFLANPMFEGAVDESTIEAMYTAIKAHLPKLRAHLKNKAKSLGLPVLGFQDLQAPLPADKSDAGSLSWDDGVELVLNAFGSYPKLQEYARNAIASGWIDAEPGEQRAPGGYCTGSPLNQEARIYMTYQNSYGDVQTLAHEIGHAFHSYLLNDDRFLRGNYPMTLAETASTFAQTLLVKDVLASKTTPAGVRSQILTEMTNDIVGFCLDIMMRYEFEKRFYTKRQTGQQLSAADFCALMTEVQIEIFGDAIDHKQLDPYFWASKGHFYFSGISFYNFPYTFGFLLSRHLVKGRLEQGPKFHETYETFMKLTAAKTCEDLCQDVLGQDIRQPKFWEAILEDCFTDLENFATHIARA